MKALFLGLLALHAFAAMATSEPGHWRTRANAGVNCLYVFLRAQGIPARYQDLRVWQDESMRRDGVSTPSVKTVCDVANRAGFPLAPVRLTPKQLRAMSGPLLVAVEGHAPEEGSIFLVISQDPDRLVCLSGASAAVSIMGWEDFGRAWSGVAMAPLPQKWPPAATLLTSVLVGLGAAIAVPRLKPRKSPTTPTKRGPVNDRGNSMSHPPILLILPLLLSLASPARCRAEDLPPEARDELSRQCQALSEVTLSSDSSGMLYSGYVSGHRFFQKVEPTGRLFWEKTIHENAFDGDTFFFGDVSARARTPPILTKFAAEDATDPERHRRLVDWPFLEAAGFRIPAALADLPREGNLIGSLVLHCVAADPDTKVARNGGLLEVSTTMPDFLVAEALATDVEAIKAQLQTAGNPASVVAKVVEGIERRRRLAPSRTVLFALDPGKGYLAVRRKEWTSDGVLAREVILEDIKLHAGRLWLPARCRDRHFLDAAYARLPLGKEQVVVHSLGQITLQAPTNAVFALAYLKPGTIISDRTVPEAKTNRRHQVRFTVNADGKILRGNVFPVSPPLPAHVRLFWLVFNLGVIGGALFFGIRFWSRQRERRTSSPVSTP